MDEKKLFSQSLIISSEQQEETSIEKILIEKLSIIRAGVIESVGSENYKEIVRYLYEVLYHSEDVEEIIEDLNIEDTRKFPDRISILKMPLSMTVKNIPSKEDFIERITRVLAVEPNFEDCVYDGAEEQLENMAYIGPVRIWTAGDNLGLNDRNGSFISGSRGQLKKISLAGNINEIRNRIGRETGRDRKDVITVAVAENKFQILFQIGKEFQEKGIKIVVIIEDNLDYLIKAEDEIKKMGLNALPIWIRQGNQKSSILEDTENDLDYYIKKYNVRDSVREISDILRENNISIESTPGFIVDYDGVIMNSAKKITVQGNAVIEDLKNNGWI